jgi:hypothetical protein
LIAPKPSLDAAVAQFISISADFILQWQWPINPIQIGPSRVGKPIAAVGTQPEGMEQQNG